MSYNPDHARIADACTLALREINDANLEQAAAREAAARAGKEPPKQQPPSCKSPKWVGRIAKILKDGELELWLRDADVVEAHADLAGPLLRRLLTWPEFRMVSEWGAVLEIRWTPKAIGRRDPVFTEVLAGSPRVVPAKDRLTWRGEGDAPDFHLELSLPWWLLASEEQRERGLHDILCYLGWSDGGPALRKPVVAHPATLARYGVGSEGEASLVFHAQRHPDHQLLMREYRFDPVTGLGERWPAGGPRQQDLVEPTPRKRTRSPKVSTSTVAEG